MLSSPRHTGLLPRQHRGSFAAVALVTLMFALALLWVRDQHTPPHAALRPLAGTQG